MARTDITTHFQTSSPFLHTAKGHLKLQRKNIKSTKISSNSHEYINTHPTKETYNTKINNVFVTILTQDEFKKSYFDLTG